MQRIGAEMPAAPRSDGQDRSATALGDCEAAIFSASVDGQLGRAFFDGRPAGAGPEGSVQTPFGLTGSPDARASHHRKAPPRLGALELVSPGLAGLRVDKR